MAKINQVQLVGAILRELGRQEVTVNHRQVNAIIVAADSIVAEMAEDRPALPNMGLEAWLRSDDTGLSSRYLARALAPRIGQRVPEERHHFQGIHWPRDPDDFGRCVRLLDAVPALRESLPEMADGHGFEWKALVSHWAELEALYREELPGGKAPRTYQRMQELTCEVQKGG